MKLDTNCEPRSDITFRGRPCSLNTCSLYKLATPCDVMVVLQGRKYAFFENRSTITRIVSFPFDVTSGPIRSTLIMAHGSEGISFGCNGAARGCWNTLKPVTGIR